MFVEILLPSVVTLPGLRVSVHVPDEGKPLRTTFPVDSVQVGWLIVSTTGAEGVGGCALITRLAEVREVHPSELVTVKVYVPVATPVMFVVGPVPSEVTPPGFRVRVQVPDEGNPLKVTLPVATVHVGCVIVPGTGANGSGGCAFITTFDDTTEIHPS